MEIIYSNKSQQIEISISTSYSKEFLKFAESIVWGTEDILYKMKDLSKEFDKFKDPVYVSLFENGVLYAICILNHKKLSYNHTTYDAFYRTVGAVHPEKINKGHYTLMVNTITEYIFSKYEKVIMYSCIEDGNKRSIRVAEKNNYTRMADFIATSTVMFKTRENKYVSKLEKRDAQVMLELLKKQYASHSMVDLEESFDADAYYVYKENNEIKAGFQVKIVRWTFLGLAGFKGFLMMKVVPKLPILKKLFNPKNHTFLKIGNMYLSDGNSFSKLLSSAMHHCKLNTSLAYLNPESAIDSKLLTKLNKGILSSTDSKAGIYYKAKNISPNEIAKPQFLSFADMV